MRHFTVARSCNSKLLVGTLDKTYSVVNMCCMKYGINDKAVITDNISGHEFKIGDVVIITEIYPEGNSPHYKAESEDDFWFVSDKELGDCQ